MKNIFVRCALLILCIPLSLPVWAQQTSAPPPPRTIPEGVTFLIRLDDTLDSSKLQQGKHFDAKLAEDLVAPDGTRIPQGKKIKGHVSSVEQGLHARVLLSFDEIDTGHGKLPLIATVTGVPGEHGMKQPDAEGEIERQGVDNRRAIETAAVGAGVGAAVGAVAAGGKGAAIGAGAGAGAGALGGILTDRRLKLDKGSVLELRLDRPLQLPGE